MTRTDKSIAGRLMDLLLQHRDDITLEYVAHTIEPLADSVDNLQHYGMGELTGYITLSQQITFTFKDDSTITVRLTASQTKPRT